jgi:predicted alpha/beta superfamily hydrolase
MISLRATLAVAILSSPALAQDSASAPWTQQSIKSSKLNEERAIYVATPDNYGASTVRYPVLVLLDANDRPQFTSAVANVRFLASRNAIPPLIVVGIPNGKDRTHDMTPAATGATAKNFATAGGASGLANFIIDEVVPLIRSQYRTLPTTILAGHSFGGLFALDVAATRPGAFTGIVAMSPSIWWNDTTAAVNYANVIGKSTTPLRLFATSGGLEQAIDRPTRLFVSKLDSIKPAAVAYAFRHYPDDTHGLTPAPSLMDGLRFVFEPISLTKVPITTALRPGADSATVVNAILETEQVYARGARSLGMPDRLPESVLNGLAYSVLRGLKQPNTALWVFRRNAAAYPDSPNVYDSLGDGLLAAGDTSAAKQQFRRSVEVATRTGAPAVATTETRKKLEALDHVTQAGKAKP